MPRNSIVWEVQVRREVLDAELGQLRGVPYALWRDVIAAPVTKLVTARDNRPYQIHVSAEYAGHGSEDIRVTLSLARAAGLKRKLMRQTFVITPDNRVRV
jgi:hypothetical protein